MKPLIESAQPFTGLALALSLPTTSAKIPANRITRVRGANNRCEHISGVEREQRHADALALGCIARTNTALLAGHADRDATVDNGSPTALVGARHFHHRGRQ